MTPSHLVALQVRVIALGNELARDDGAALRCARRLPRLDGIEVLLAGRPGAGLLDVLDAAIPTLLLDVVRHGVETGALVEMALSDLADASVATSGVSSHGLGCAEALALARALGRPLPNGTFLGIGGAAFGPGDTLSPGVEAGLPAYAARAEAILVLLRSGSPR